MIRQSINFTFGIGFGYLVVDGKEYELNMGTSCILPNQVKEWQIKGDVRIISSDTAK